MKERRGAPPPDLPDGGVSLLQRSALSRPDGAPGEQSGEVAAGVGVTAGVGLVVGVAASGRGGVGEGAGGGEAEAIPHYQCMLHY